MNGCVTEHATKEKKIIHEHFSEIMRKGGSTNKDFNWDELNIESHELIELEATITEEEVRAAIFEMPSDKAFGTDGFTGAFFKRCWITIKHDIMRVIHLLDSLHTSNLYWLNSANVVLLPKKEGAEGIADYTPISLIHATAKIIAKMLSIRLAPHMNSLVSNMQSDFIKRRSIHTTSCVSVVSPVGFTSARLPPSPSSFDIRKAFDSIKWEYILDLLQRKGVPK